MNTHILTCEKIDNLALDRHKDSTENSNLIFYTHSILKDLYFPESKIPITYLVQTTKFSSQTLAIF